MSTVKELREQAKEALDALYSACQRDVEKLEEKISGLEILLDDDCPDCDAREKEIYALESRLPEWGNCARGCPPAYLVGGFCSPACALGAPRGEFVTVREEVASVSA